VSMKGDYLGEGKFSYNQVFMALCNNLNSGWNSLFRKSNGSDPENNESRSSKMVCLHQSPEIT
jgi:hypothetical protein